MKKLALILALFLPSLAFAACSSTSYANGWTCVQQASGAAAAFTSTVTVSMSPTAGHGIIAGTFMCGNELCAPAVTSTIVIKDNINNPETCFTASPNSPFSLGNGSVNTQEYIYVCPNIPSGVTSFTITCAGTCTNHSYAGLWLSEWTGMATSSAIDKDGSGVSAGGGTTATTTLTGATTNANDLVYALIFNDNNESATVGSTYTAISANTPVTGGMSEAKSVTSTSTYTATSTWTGSDTWEGAMVAVKSSAAGGTKRLRGAVINK